MLKRLPIQLLIIPSSLLSCFFIGTLFNFQAKALPGQSTEEVATWIKAHPTLRPESGEQFFIQKSDTAAQRFTFLASVLPPGRAEIPNNRSVIRTERLAMYDAINGMTFERLEESLRIIYGLDIYQDFNNAQLIYEYPTQSIINRARFAKTPIKEALRGELRVGDRYAYWVEIAKPRDGKAFTGQMTVLLKTDVDKLEEELQSR